MKIWTERTAPVGPILLGMAALFALLLALPGQTVATKYLNDLFVILDSTYRVASGQVPNRDFHTPLGPLAYYIPVLGYELFGTLGRAMPTAMALATFGLALPLAHVLTSRLRPVIAIPFGIFLLLIVAVPINLGESITALSFAKYYNRIGWAALGTLLVMYLAPMRSQARQDALDMICAAALTLLMLYTKLTYGVVALGFLLFMLTDPRQRRWSAGAIGITLVTALVIEAFWRSSLAHLADLRMALDVGGFLRGTWGQITDHILFNLTDYVLLGLFAGLALRETRSIRDALFYGYCAVTGFLIINHNFQAWGIISLHAAAAVAAETILRVQERQATNIDEHRWSMTAGAKLLFLAVVLPTIVHCAAALGLHTVTASARAGEPVGLPRLEQVRLANLWTWNDYDAAAPYLATLRDGVEALSGLDRRPAGILVLDVGNPFSMALGASPPKGDTPWLQWERTLSGKSHIPAETLLANVQIVMEPKPAGDSNPAQSQSQSLQALYGPYIASNFDVARETDHWKLYRRRQPTAPQAALDEAGRS
jgi:hypothetical protein